MKGFQEARGCGLTVLKLGAPGSKGQPVLAAVCDSDTAEVSSQLQPESAALPNPPGDKARRLGTRPSASGRRFISLYISF